MFKGHVSLQFDFLLHGPKYIALHRMTGFIMIRPSFIILIPITWSSNFNSSLIFTSELVMLDGLQLLNVARLYAIRTNHSSVKLHSSIL